MLVVKIFLLDLSGISISIIDNSPEEGHTHIILYIMKTLQLLAITNDADEHSLALSRKMEHCY